MKYIFFILFSIASSSLMALHPTHLSVVNMSLNPDTQEINYSIRVFQDDINYLITALYHEELFHSTDTFDLAANTEKLENYFIQTVQVFVNDSILTPQLEKKESEETEYWLYFKIKLSAIPDKLVIRNRILMDIYSDQTNLVIFSYKNQQKGLTFTLENQKQNVNLAGTL